MADRSPPAPSELVAIDLARLETAIETELLTIPQPFRRRAAGIVAPLLAWAETATLALAACEGMIDAINRRSRPDG